MKQLLVWMVILCAAPVLAQTDLEKKLFDLPDVRFEKIKAPDGFSAAYLLQVRQPIDHHDESKGYFYQRVWFTHRGFDKPTVINTAGYHCNANRIYEMTELLNANQLRVEHRFFGTSTPDKTDDKKIPASMYQYLNMEQATADLHHIRELFAQIYPNKWAATGISKGGMTCLYYRYFYPDDVDVSVPYVAPVDTTYEDPRIYQFLKKQGNKSCRKHIRQIQDRLLTDREDALLRLKWYTKGKGYTFDYLGFEKAFEYGVLEYPFSFWQVGHQCKDIPDKNAPMDEIVEYFNKVVGLSLFSDSEIETFGSHYYQAATETGYYGYLTEPFAGKLKKLTGHPHATFVPQKMKTTYHKELSNKLYNWCQTKGNHIIYIYGKRDTWTAAGVPKSDQVDSEWFIMDGRSHIDARIKNFNPEEKARFDAALNKWINWTPSQP